MMAFSNEEIQIIPIYVGVALAIRPLDEHGEGKKEAGCLERELPKQPVLI